MSCLLDKFVANVTPQLLVLLQLPSIAVRAGWVQLSAFSWLTYDSQRSTHSYCRCPCGRTNTLGVLTGIMVTCLRRGPVLPRLQGQQQRRHNGYIADLCQLDRTLGKSWAKAALLSRGTTAWRNRAVGPALMLQLHWASQNVHVDLAAACAAPWSTVSTPCGTNPAEEACEVQNLTLLRWGWLRPQAHLRTLICLAAVCQNPSGRCFDTCCSWPAVSSRHHWVWVVRKHQQQQRLCCWPPDQLWAYLL